MSSRTLHVAGALLGCAILLLAACSQNADTLALGTLERDLIRLSATASEIITEVYVDEGGRVKQGDLLLQLDNSTRQAAMEEAQASVDSSLAYLQQLRNGAREEERAAARARVANAQARALEAEKNHARIKQLVDRKLLGEAELDAAVAQRDSTRAVVKDAREQLALLLSGTRQEQIDQAEARWRQAQQALSIARKNLQDLRITATRDGRIDSLPWHRGERVPVGAVLAVLLAQGNPYVRAYVPESERANLMIGQRLSVSIDGVDGTFMGTLTHIQHDPAFTPHYALTETERSRLVYLAEVQLGDDAAELPSGIPAQVNLSASGTLPAQ